MRTPKTDRGLIAGPHRGQRSDADAVFAGVEPTLVIAGVAEYFVGAAGAEAIGTDLVASVEGGGEDADTDGGPSEDAEHAMARAVERFL